MRVYRGLLPGFLVSVTVIFVLLNSRPSTVPLNAFAGVSIDPRKRDGRFLKDYGFDGSQVCLFVNRFEKSSVFLFIENFYSYATRTFSRAKFTSKVLVGFYDWQKTYRYVTPSLAELGSRGNLPEMNKHVLMLTRVPGAGAELLVLILQRLQGYNAFKHIRLPPGDSGLLTTLQQELLVEEITSIIRQEAIPLSFDGDVRFLNFSEFGRQAPTFLAIARDPLDPRTLQRYRKGGASALYRGAISHFCGQDPRCSKRNSKWALERAKANVVRWYPVVGLLDYMEETLRALKKEFPYFFTGALHIYNKLRPKVNYSRKRTETLKNRTRKVLEEVLAEEIEFYKWLKFRLLNETRDNG